MSGADATTSLEELIAEGAERLGLPPEQRPVYVDFARAFLGVVDRDRGAACADEVEDLRHGGLRGD